MGLSVFLLIFITSPLSSSLKFGADAVRLLDRFGSKSQTKADCSSCWSFVLREPFTCGLIPRSQNSYRENRYWDHRAPVDRGMSLINHSLNVSENFWEFSGTQFIRVIYLKSKIIMDRPHSWITWAESVNQSCSANPMATLAPHCDRRGAS